jgi:bifunctional DNA-binding transcriptional regulator/antitoxin component of YhaV-PrlF toxin-antitoxin module
MAFTTKMTQKGQVTIPKHIRDKLSDKISADFLVLYDEQLQEVRLKPLLTPEELAGSLKSKVVLSDEELREARSQFGSRWPQD